jgi:hypothetical protein
MSNKELADEILANDRFKTSLAAISMESVLRDLPELRSSAIAPEIEMRPEWSFVLTCASLLAQINAEQAQDAALRVAQGAMLSDDTTRNERAGAAVLMERLGNRLGLGLAAGRQKDDAPIDENSWEQAPGPLQLDVIRRRLEMAIFVEGFGEIAGNPFQRELWSSLEDAQWVSASAPTSAGKSFIVRRWFGQQVTAKDRFVGIYLVPTRALIEEVSREIRTEMGREIGVYTIPWDKNIGSSPREIHVLTQERLHFLYEQYPQFTPDLLFIDEAQKFGDPQRGVLLQRVLADSLRRNANLQVTFASPMAGNPELLLEGGPQNSIAITSETVTVNQNLLWADQVARKPLQWTASLIEDGQATKAGDFRLVGRSIKDTKRLPLVAVALGRSSSGNVVYVNTAKSAETTASQIADALGPKADISDRGDISALQELIEKTIHRHYALVPVIKRGVAFHYGNMPLLVRKEIEDLFRAGVLKYLVCTSTLLEGVNLPCRNIFIRGPKKGSEPMSSADFWNLAGRAGRWGKEFEGNIVCVDTQRRNVWVDPPRARTRTPLRRASEPVLRDLDALRSYVEADAPVEEIWKNGLKEDVYSFLASRVLIGQALADLPNMPDDDVAEIQALEGAIKQALEKIEIPDDVLRRHAGISPPSMQRLLSYIREHPEQEAMLLVLPEDDDAAVNYKRALSRCDKQLGSSFGPADKRLMQLAILIVNWMKGRPLAYLIAKRIDVNSKRDNRNVPRDIRGTMKDVDEVARFAAPRYLACYLDVLKVHLAQTGRDEDAAALPDISMMLELGVARTTEVSMMALGLSRATAIALEEYISDDELSPEQCLNWLRQANIEGFELPALVEREIREVIERSEPLAA